MGGDEHILRESFQKAMYRAIFLVSFVLLLLFFFSCSCQIWNSPLYLNFPHFNFFADVRIFKGHLRRTLGIVQVRSIECVGLDGGHLILD